MAKRWLLARYTPQVQTTSIILVLVSTTVSAAPKPTSITPGLVHKLTSDPHALEGMIDPKHPPLIRDVEGTACSPDDAACMKAVPKRPASPRELLKQMGDQRELTCDNTYVAKDDPDFDRWDPYGDVDSARAGHPLQYATCDLMGAGEYVRSYHLLFVRDKTATLRLAAMVIDEVGTRRAWLPRVASDVARIY